MIVAEHRVPFDFGAALPNRKPFLKWAGNKNRAKQHILPHLPGGNRLVEPFAGSCAISLATYFDSYLIADANADLIEMYNFIKADAQSVILEAESLFAPAYNNAEAFYFLRSEFNTAPSSVRKSAIFIYLNRHGFNGLCRYNSSGGFNVPFGRYRAPNCPSSEMDKFGQFAQRAEFRCQSFEKTFAEVRAGDVVYCDPPYVPLSATSNFTAYAKDAFGLPLQKKLKICAVEAAKNGSPSLISNHDTPVSRKLYHDGDLKFFEVQRLISSKASTRGMAPELLAIYDAA